MHGISAITSSGCNSGTDAKGLRTWPAICTARRSRAGVTRTISPGSISTTSWLRSPGRRSALLLAHGLSPDYCWRCHDGGVASRWRPMSLTSLRFRASRILTESYSSQAGRRPHKGRDNDRCKSSDPWPAPHGSRPPLDVRNAVAIEVAPPGARPTNFFAGKLDDLRSQVDDA